MKNEEFTPESTPSEHTERPLGYWLRAVDTLITRAFADALEGAGVSRREWMALNVLSGDAQAPGLAERLARKGKVLARLESRGWAAAKEDGTWELTDEGRVARSDLAEAVGGIRDRVTGAVSPEDYATMTAALEAIADEFGGAASAWPDRGARGNGRGSSWRGRGERGRGRGERGRGGGEHGGECGHHERDREGRGIHHRGGHHHCGHHHHKAHRMDVHIHVHPAGNVTLS
ncbi:MarR family winged helix-turn-helix transcriptional regulator [Microbacterium sp. C7(2022)]|uniref:MarR family winged helix-turn-helix transcriptional regulator n=1 Tax=Microbacterium sp. C7(2022) TaxID=2992759 RepID=UPI00237A3D73|nr:hypothetical protein [Microbacterium sp. C7(2022)]MDE0546465.1 hypothetical protein [Microbacterium sp. C7(2022)]